MLCLTMTHAAETESPTDEKATKVVKVAVTGSSIKGVAAQSASPITIVKVDEILKQGSPPLRRPYLKSQPTNPTLFQRLM